MYSYHYTQVSQSLQQYSDSSLNANLCGHIHIRSEHLLDINVRIVAKPVTVQVIPML
jgi:hypothetical protein